MGAGYACHRDPQKVVIEVRSLPTAVFRLLCACAPPFLGRVCLLERVWQNAQVECDGLGPARTVPSLPPCSQPCQLVESAGEQRALGLPVRTFAPEGPLLVGIDETRKRRWGKKISPRGVYRGPVRCTHGNLVTYCSRTGLEQQVEPYALR